jgi:hypothetical protein
MADNGNFLRHYDRSEKMADSYPVRKLKFPIDVVLSAALWAKVRLSL